MKHLLRSLAFVLMVGSAYAQSNLPACRGSDVSKWSNCYGTAFYHNLNTNKFKYFVDNNQFNANFHTKFEGDFKDGLPNGKGTFIFANGSKYVGELKDDKFNGQGTFTLGSGAQFVGEYKDGKRDGQGILTYSDRSKYVGEFKNDKFNGQGIEYASNGSVTSHGIWADDKLVRSELVQQASVANQAVAVASAQPNISPNNLPACPPRGIFNNCFTSYTFPNGLKYVGAWKENKYHGQGTLFASNGSVISEGLWAEGNFVRSAPVQQASVANQIVAAVTALPNVSPSNRPACPSSGYLHNCFGTYTYPSGNMYIGEFFQDKRSGQGIFYSSSGSIISQGIWSYDNLVQSVPVQQATASSALSNNAERDRLTAEVEVERKKRQELEQQLAAAKERDQITAELDFERKKRQELEAQLAASVKPSPPQTSAPRRIAHALVIGNGAYPGSGRLDNPVNDANAISQKLRSMGFTVTTVIDANRQRLVQSMTQFRRTASSADISLLYYAGHGVQIFGTNYILPTDVDQTDPAQATIQGVSLNSVVENFLPGKTKLVFLDACRDNALQRTNDRSVSKGLAPISAAEGTLISYATKDGQTAADGVGSKNSPFTQALLEHLNDPQDIAVVLRKVRERVMKITGGKQQPWEYGSLTGGELVLSAIKPK